MGWAQYKNPKYYKKAIQRQGQQEINQQLLEYHLLDVEYFDDDWWDDHFFDRWDYVGSAEREKYLRYAKDSLRGTGDFWERDIISVSDLVKNYFLWEWDLSYDGLIIIEPQLQGIVVEFDYLEDLMKLLLSDSSSPKQLTEFLLHPSKGIRELAKWRRGNMSNMWEDYIQGLLLRCASFSTKDFRW